MGYRQDRSATSIVDHGVSLVYRGCSLCVTCKGDLVVDGETSVKGLVASGAYAVAVGTTARGAMCVCVWLCLCQWRSASPYALPLMNLWSCPAGQITAQAGLDITSGATKTQELTAAGKQRPAYRRLAPTLSVATQDGSVLVAAVALRSCHGAEQPGGHVRWLHRGDAGRRRRSDDGHGPCRR